MHPDIRLLTYAVILTWIQIMAGSALRAGGNLGRAVDNRDDDVPLSPMAHRAARSARNMLENMVLFTALLLAAQAAGVGGTSRVVLGARLFFFARLVYFPVYLAGITYVRTAIWAVGVVGMALIASAIL